MDPIDNLNNAIKEFRQETQKVQSIRTLGEKITDLLDRGNANNKIMESAVKNAGKAFTDLQQSGADFAKNVHELSEGIKSAEKERKQYFEGLKTSMAQDTERRNKDYSSMVATQKDCFKELDAMVAEEKKARQGFYSLLKNDLEGTINALKSSVEGQLKKAVSDYEALEAKEQAKRHGQYREMQELVSGEAEARKQYYQKLDQEIAKVMPGLDKAVSDAFNSLLEKELKLIGDEFDKQNKILQSIRDEIASNSEKYFEQHRELIADIHQQLSEQKQGTFMQIGRLGAEVQTGLDKQDGSIKKHSQKLFDEMKDTNQKLVNRIGKLESLVKFSLAGSGIIVALLAALMFFKAR